MAKTKIATPKRVKKHIRKNKDFTISVTPNSKVITKTPTPDKPYTTKDRREDFEAVRKVKIRPLENFCEFHKNIPSRWASRVQLGSLAKKPSKKPYVPPSLGELQITVKKHDTFTHKKHKTTVLWMCKVWEDYLESFLFNMFNISLVFTKNIYDELATKGTITLPAVVTKYDYWKGGEKRKRMPRHSKLQTVKTVTITVI